MSNGTSQIYNEGRVVGYSAYETYVKGFLENDPSGTPANEREWLSASLASGTSILLHVPADENASIAPNGYQIIPIYLPLNTSLRAANTIMASWVNMTAGDEYIRLDTLGLSQAPDWMLYTYYSYDSMADKYTVLSAKPVTWSSTYTDYYICVPTKITSYSDTLACNNATKSPTNGLQLPSAVPTDVASASIIKSDDTKNAIRAYYQIKDGVVLQAGTWSNNSDPLPQKKFVPDLSQPPLVRFLVEGKLTSDFYVLLTGFTDAGIITGTTGIGDSIDTNAPEDGDFLGPATYPWANKIIITTTNVTLYPLLDDIKDSISEFLKFGTAHNIVDSGNNPLGVQYVPIYEGGNPSNTNNFIILPQTQYPDTRDADYSLSEDTNGFINWNQFFKILNPDNTETYPKRCIDALGNALRGVNDGITDNSLTPLDNAPRRVIITKNGSSPYTYGVAEDVIGERVNALINDPSISIGSVFVIKKDNNSVSLSNDDVAYTFGNTLSSIPGTSDSDKNKRYVIWKNGDNVQLNSNTVETAVVNASSGYRYVVKKDSSGNIQVERDYVGSVVDSATNGDRYVIYKNNSGVISVESDIIGAKVKEVAESSDPNGTHYTIRKSNNSVNLSRDALADEIDKASFSSRYVIYKDGNGNISVENDIIGTLVQTISEGSAYGNGTRYVIRKSGSSVVLSRDTIGDAVANASNNHQYIIDTTGGVVSLKIDKIGEAVASLAASISNNTSRRAVIKIDRIDSNNISYSVVTDNISEATDSLIQSTTSSDVGKCYDLRIASTPGGSRQVVYTPDHVKDAINAHGEGTWGIQIIWEKQYCNGTPQPVPNTGTPIYYTGTYEGHTYSYKPKWNGSSWEPWSTGVTNQYYTCNSNGDPYETVDLFNIPRNIPNLPGSNGTYKLQVSNGTYTWVAE